jgi:NAD(P)-dependent dehydrogenase (short-subunit alcohol dehydrogenase family)
VSELAGRVAIVTGGAGGIGRAMVETFVAAGASVVIADLDVDAGSALAGDLGDAASFARVDVAEADDVQALVDFTVAHFGGLHVMFNNAGIGSSFARLLDNDLADYDRVMSVNLLGVMLGTQRAARHMAEHGGGSIINTSSNAALTGGAGPIVYRAAKAAVIHFSRGAAIDLADFNIRVNVIAPGHIQTPITTYDMGPVIEFTQPLQRRGSPADVAQTALYFASDQSAQVTGVTIPVDGGTVAGPPAGVMGKIVRLNRPESSGDSDAR